MNKLYPMMGTVTPKKIPETNRKTGWWMCKNFVRIILTKAATITCIT